MHKNKIFLGILIFIGVFFINSIGSAASFLDNMSLGWERSIGENNYQTIIHQKRVVQLPPQEAAHLNDLFQRLVNCCSRGQEIPFSLTVLQDESVNAFALPGGYVFVNTGLLNYVKSDGELAGIIGHEIAHIDRKHGMRAVYRAVGFSVLLTLLAGTAKNNEQEKISRMAAITLNLAQLGYSRDAEYEADRLGVQLMARAGYPKQDLLYFWSRLEAAESNKTPAFMTMFATHPPTRERIKRIQALQ